MYCSLLPRYAASGWLMLTVLAPSRYAALLHTARWEASTANSKGSPGYSIPGETVTQGFSPGQCGALVVVRDRHRKVDRCQQEEHIRLHHGDAQVQRQEDQRDADRHQREERQRHQVAREHIRVQPDRQ